MHTLVGRATELDRVDKAIDALTMGRGGAFWIEGEAGIGKTALLAALTAKAQAKGCEVFTGRATEFDQRLPLHVLADVFAQLSHGRAAGSLWEAAQPSSDPGPGAVRIAEAQLLDAIDRGCTSTPMVVILDDTQWADDATLELFSRLRAVASQQSLLIVASCRTPVFRHSVSALRTSLAGGEASLVDLRPLDDAGVLSLVRAVTGGDPAPALREWIQVAGGNPLYIHELLDTAATHGLLRVIAGVADLASSLAVPQPTSLTAAIAARTAPLPATVLNVLRPAALIGPEFSLGELHAICAGNPPDLDAALRDAIAAGVLDPPTERRPDLFTFRHPMVHKALLDAVPAPLRAAMHREAAEKLAGIGASVERVASHVLSARGLTDNWTREWVCRAAPVLCQRAPEFAEELLTSVLDGTDSDDFLHTALEVRLMQVSLRLTKLAETERLATSLLEKATDPVHLGEAAWALAYVTAHRRRREDLREIPGRLAEDPRIPAEMAARLRGLHALALIVAGAGQEGRTIAKAALAVGRRLRDRAAIGQALHALSYHASMNGDMPGALRYAEEALTAIGDDPTCVDLRVLLLVGRAADLASSGRFPEALAVARQASVTAERVGGQRLSTSRVQTSEILVDIGQWDDALVEIEATPESRIPMEQVHQHALIAMIAAHRDERETADAHLAAIDAIVSPGSDLDPDSALRVHLARAVVAERSGDTRAALDHLAALLDPAVGSFMQNRYHQLPELVRVALSSGDRAVAESAYNACVEAARSLRIPAASAAVAACRGLLRVDPDALLQAAEKFGDLPLPLCQAKCLENAAVLLAERGDIANARAAYLRAVDIYERLLAAWDVLRVDWRMRALGIRRGRHGTRRRPSHGWDALTATERKVACLITDGYSTPDIADALYISRRTVQTHVSHILTKLQVTSRVEILRKVHRLCPQDL